MNPVLSSQNKYTAICTGVFFFISQPLISTIARNIVPLSSNPQLVLRARIITTISTCGIFALLSKSQSKFIQVALLVSCLACGFYACFGGRISTSLDLSSKRLGALPDDFGGWWMSSLKELDLRTNQLTILPESFGSLTSLKNLFLSGNQLKTLPESFGSLTSLEHLSLRYNQLTILPESFRRLTSLEHLFLEQNQLKTLPESFANLKALRTLDLSNNRFTVIPECLLSLSPDCKVFMKGNLFSEKYIQEFKAARQNDPRPRPKFRL